MIPPAVGLIRSGGWAEHSDIKASSHAAEDLTS